MKYTYDVLIKINRAEYDITWLRSEPNEFKIRQCFTDQLLSSAISS